MNDKIKLAAKRNILFNHRTADRVLRGEELSAFGEECFKQGAQWQKDNMWTSVEEGLPPCNSDDLFLLGIDDVGHENIIDVGYMHAARNNKPRVDLFICGTLVCVTHWMYKPKMNK